MKMNRDKVLKILEKITIILVTAIMVLVMANQYIKTSQGAINESFRIAQIFIAIAVVVLTLIMAIVSKNKKMFFVMLGFYALTAALFYVFKSANRI